MKGLIYIKAVPSCIRSLNFESKPLPTVNICVPIVASAV